MRPQLFLYDLGILDHRHTTAICQLAFYSDGFTAVVGELIVDRLVFANDQIRFALAQDADRASAFDAFGPARLAVLFAHCVMIDIAHQIDYFAADGFFSGRAQILFSVLVLLCDRQRRECQSGDESRDYRNFQDGWFFG